MDFIAQHILYLQLLFRVLIFKSTIIPGISFECKYPTPRQVLLHMNL